jgi:hypothetical protein
MDARDQAADLRGPDIQPTNELGLLAHSCIQLPGANQYLTVCLLSPPVSVFVAGACFGL